MARLHVNIHDKKATINKNIYGHFSEHLGRCIYDGLYVGENSKIPNKNGMRSDVVEALKNIKIPVLRWPGGCFADEYHWKDGIGPKEQRKKMVNTHWGKVVEDNSFGTHEFMELCEQLGCEPYINGNVGSGTVQEMQEWVEYLTFDGISPMAKLRTENGREKPWKVKYWGVGNENWGCGGNMRPEYYADVYRQFQTYIRNFGDNKIYKIACGANDWNYDWTEKVMAIAGKYMDAITLHYYTLPNDDWNNKGSATQFEEAIYYRTIKKALNMDEIVSNHLQIMNKYDPEHKVGLIVDEWGTWFDVEPGTNPGFLYQQNTMRDAVVASVTLDIFNKNADRVVMANIAQTVNVLQAMVLTDGEKMLLTPTYHVFDLYKEHHDATLLGHWLEEGISGDGKSKIPHLSATVSEKDNQIIITITNLSATEPTDVDIFIPGVNCKNVKGRLLSGNINAMNDFENSNNVAIKSLSDVKGSDGAITCKLPACSVAELIMNCDGQVLSKVTKTQNGLQNSESKQRPACPQCEV